jgi:hypothetical protein
MTREPVLHLIGFEQLDLFLVLSEIEPQIGDADQKNRCQIDRSKDQIRSPESQLRSAVPFRKHYMTHLWPANF